MKIAEFQGSKYTQIPSRVRILQMTDQEFARKFGYAKFDPFQEENIYKYLANRKRNAKKETRQTHQSVGKNRKKD